MFSQFFGNYLLEKGLISKEDLSEVLAVQEETRVKLGVLAVNLGYMEPREVEKVHNKQATRDEMFGELAVEMGYLTKKQLKEVLSLQKKEHHLMSQALIDKNIISLEELEQVFENYRDEKDLSREEFAAIKQNRVEKIVDVFLDFGSAKKSELYKDYTILLVKNIIRFISDNLRIKGLREVESFTFEEGACQQVKGDNDLFTALLADEEEFVSFANRYSDIKIEASGELARDSVAEFINLQNGIFLVNCSDQGIKMEMEPQRGLKEKTLQFSGQAYVISFALDLGEVEFLLAAERPEIN